MENNPTSPELVAESRERLEKAEDLEALRCLEEMRQKPLELRRLDDFLAERSQDA